MCVYGSDGFLRFGNEEVIDDDCFHLKSLSRGLFIPEIHSQYSLIRQDGITHGIALYGDFYLRLASHFPISRNKSAHQHRR